MTTFGRLTALLAIVALAHGGNPSYGQTIPGEGNDFYEGPGVLVSEILIARGYLAKDFYVRSDDGYWIRITRGRNPLINNGQGGLPGKVPIMFIHGILESYNVFVINSFDARPSDFSNVSLTELSLSELNTRFGDVPSAKSLPLFAMDCGHEVFIMSRRGFPGSQMLTGDPLFGSDDRSASLRQSRGPVSAFLATLTNYNNLIQEVAFSFDPKFWNFSLDEQVKYDFKLVVDFIRNQTERAKIAVVAHSAGGTIVLQALSLHPELNDELSAVILWSQGFSLGHGDLFNLLTPALPLLQAYVGSFPPAFSTSQIQASLGLICASPLTQSTLCEGLADLILGFSAGQEPTRPEFINSLLYSSSSHELAQMLQCVLLGGQMHQYANDLITAAANPYDLATITNNKMSFYVGATETLVPVSDVMATLPLLRVPYKFHVIDTTFNHNGYFYHKNTSRLAIIPSLREIQLMS